ncbi:VOC family protein [bacterium]|nr:VOC family protein [bacterium]
MKIEHFALQVADPVAMARWYVVHLGMTIQRSSNQSPFAHFLADDGGQMLIEIYRNEQFDIPNHGQVPPAHFHLAFITEDIEKDRVRLIEAGAKEEGPIGTQPNGDLVCFLRDPWGLTLQLCSRVEKLLA